MMIVAAATISADCALSVGEVVLADFLADRHDDSLPPDHGAKPQCQRDGELYPGRNELRHVAQLRNISGLVGSKQLFVRRIGDGLAFGEFSNRGVGQVDIAAKLFARFDRNPVERCSICKPRNNLLIDSAIPPRRSGR